MDAVTLVVFVAIFIVIIIAVNSVRSRRGGIVAGGRGPYSPETEARGGLAAFGATIPEPSDGEREEQRDLDRLDDD